MIELARRPDELVNAEMISVAQDIPAPFLRSAILPDLRRAGLVLSTRGPEGGYRLARPADEISLGDVIRGADGPLASVHGERPQDVVYAEHTQVLRDVWVAMRASLREVLDTTTLEHLVQGTLPDTVMQLLESPACWQNR